MNIPARQRVLEIAQAELLLGVREDVANDVDSLGRIREYYTSVGDPASQGVKSDVLTGARGWAWCAAFVSWVYELAGLPLGSGFSYVPHLDGWLENNGYLRESDYEPDPGDLILFSEKGIRQDHVGIVVKFESGRVHTIEGNLSNGLRARSLRDDHPSILGYGVVLSE